MRRIIDAGDVGVGVAAGNAGTRLALDGRRGVNGGAVAKQVAVGGVAVGGTHASVLTGLVVTYGLVAVVAVSPAP